GAGGRGRRREVRHRAGEAGPAGELVRAARRRRAGDARRDHGWRLPRAAPAARGAAEVARAALSPGRLPPGGAAVRSGPGPPPVPYVPDGSHGPGGNLRGASENRPTAPPALERRRWPASSPIAPTRARSTRVGRPTARRVPRGSVPWLQPGGTAARDPLLS